MDTWTRISAWALGGAAVFTTLHVADELWSRWDIGETMVTSGAYAGLVVAGPLALALLALAGIVLGRKWGFALGIAIGLYSLYPPITHVVSAEGMGAYRWTVEALAAAAGLVLVAASARELMLLRPTTRAKAIGQ